MSGEVLVRALTRPIIGIEHRTAWEVRDILFDRIRRALPTEPDEPTEAMIEADVRIAAWNACKKYGMADDTVYAFINAMAAELAALRAAATSSGGG